MPTWLTDILAPSSCHQSKTQTNLLIIQSKFSIKSFMNQEHSTCHNNQHSYSIPFQKVKKNLDYIKPIISHLNWDNLKRDVEKTNHTIYKQDKPSKYHLAANSLFWNQEKENEREEQKKIVNQTSICGEQ